MEPHGLSRWRHGCSRTTPVSPRRRPGEDTVAPGVFSVYQGIWQPSRLLPVSPGCFKHFKTTGDMSRFNTVQLGSSRISKPPRSWHGSSRFIPDHQTGVNRHLKPGQWERGLRTSTDHRRRKKMLKTSAKITVSVRNYWAFFQLNVKFSQVQVIFCFKKRLR